MFWSKKKAYQAGYEQGQRDLAYELQKKIPKISKTAVNNAMVEVKPKIKEAMKKMCDECPYNKTNYDFNDGGYFS